MTCEEAKFAMEFPKMFAIPPGYELKRYDYRGAKPAEVKTYRSDEVAPLNKAQLKRLLYAEELLDRRKQHVKDVIRKAN